MEGLVVKKNADLFSVLSRDKIWTVPARNLKGNGVFVGDKVTFNSNVIESVKTRKNLLIRPPIANLDTMIIVVAPLPEPDFLLVDKLIIFCVVNGIKPKLCVNKTDLNEKFADFVFENYSSVLPCEKISATAGTSSKLLHMVSGVTALAGQSAVGKSSIINDLLKKNVAVTGTLSAKGGRGKQTTRIVELYSLGRGKFLADTAGFSKLDEKYLGIDEHELKSYYPDFIKFAGGCKYKTCDHTLGDCAVLEAVKNGKVSVLRYENYKILLKNLKNLKKF